MTTIRIKNLRLRTIVGIFQFEREEVQDIIINLKIKYDDSVAVKTDNVEDALDYDKLTRKITEKVEKSRFFLLEKLTEFILNTIKEDKRITYIKLKIDKPGAIKFADSVSIIKSWKYSGDI